MSKVNTQNRVEKELSPEEKTVVENILSLMSQLKGSATSTEEVVMSESEGQDVLKEKAGPTADAKEKAEDRVEDGTDISEENYKEVGKKLGASIMTQVEKGLQRNSENTAIMSALSDITQVLKSISDKADQNAMAIVNIVEGLGVTKAVVEEAETSVKKSEENRPIGTIDNTGILAEMTSVLKSLAKSNEDSKLPSNWNVAKDNRELLRQVGPMLLSNRF